MSQNMINLDVRFFLELFALFAMGYWGWNSASGGLRYLLAIATPVVAATLWGTFRVNWDSPKGRAPIPVPGIVRLVLEIAFFSFAAWGLFVTGATTVAWVFSGVTLVHYVVSYDRVWRLLKQ